jgi:hypothetical protein
VTGVCPACATPIRWVSKAGGWVHDNGSVWCTHNPQDGSCVLGPEGAT